MKQSTTAYEILYTDFGIFVNLKSSDISCLTQKCLPAPVGDPLEVLAGEKRACTEEFQRLPIGALLRNHRIVGAPDEATSGEQLDCFL